VNARASAREWAADDRLAVVGPVCELLGIGLQDLLEYEEAAPAMAGRLAEVCRELTSGAGLAVCAGQEPAPGPRLSGGWVVLPC